MPVDFCRHLVGKKLRERFVIVIALKYALFVSQWSCGHFLKLTDSILFEWRDKSSPFKSTHYIVLRPQNGDRIVTIDSVTWLRPICGNRCSKTHRFESGSWVKGTDRKTDSSFVWRPHWLWGHNKHHAQSICLCFVSSCSHIQRDIVNKDIYYSWSGRARQTRCAWCNDVVDA